MKQILKNVSNGKKQLQLEEICLLQRGIPIHICEHGKFEIMGDCVARESKRGGDHLKFKKGNIVVLNWTIRDLNGITSK
jgi:hypothetical protein